MRWNCIIAPRIVGIATRAPRRPNRNVAADTRGGRAQLLAGAVTATRVLYTTWDESGTLRPQDSRIYQGPRRHGYPHPCTGRTRCTEATRAAPLRDAAKRCFSSCGASRCANICADLWIWLSSSPTATGDPLPCEICHKMKLWVAKRGLTAVISARFIKVFAH